MLIALRNCLSCLFLALFCVANSQNAEFQVASIGFYNVENLFDDIESSMFIDYCELNKHNPKYVSTKSKDSEEVKKQFNSTNLKVASRYIDESIFPIYPVKGLSFKKIKLKKYNKYLKSPLSKAALKAEILENDLLFNRKEFKAYIKDAGGEKSSIDLKSCGLWKLNYDKENTPNEERLYTEKVYEDKLEKLASVISSMGIEYSSDGAAIVGIAEVESEKALNDLVNQTSIKNRNYKILHFDCAYNRGVDVALLYQEKYFKVLSSEVSTLPYYSDKKKQKNRYFTRDILVVEGLFLNEPMYILVNHWPSRRGGEAKSSYGRELGAKMCRDKADKILEKNNDAHIIVMGDFNDDPKNKSTKTVLNAQKNIPIPSEKAFYNPLFKDYKKGYGSLGYRGSWNLFDQIVLSASLVDKNLDNWEMHDAKILYNQDWITRFGAYEGVPNRSFGGNNYQGGYSDHLPSIIYIKRNVPKDKDGDGVPDSEDKCIDEKGLKKFYGCPDSDNDGIEDSKDKCPNKAGEKINNGCPDSDGDGISDDKDQCINEPGPSDNAGCPKKDSDNDGIIDDIDKCPNAVGPKRNNGCPEIEEELKKAAHEAFNNLLFEINTANIHKSSDDELEQLATALKKYSDWTVIISGHTDNTGSNTTNERLSKERAEAVKVRLVSLGIPESQIKALYYGSSKPVASNDTKEGRAQNRRVEFDFEK